ncbi:hypothetical protein AC062_1861 [Pasteurellaceae bacterium NI1060]|nr:hypothetical protein AC062_1861 [Pasteurellaceae bacterium NI1060]
MVTVHFLLLTISFCFLYRLSFDEKSTFLLDKITLKFNRTF